MIRQFSILALLAAMSLTCWGQVTGDANGDGVVTSADMDLVCGVSKFSEELDLDGDGTVANDAEFLLELTGFQRGDTNFDGLVQFKDFVTLSANFGQEGAVWSDGDFDCDGWVAFADFLELYNNFGEFPDLNRAEIASVPEPSSTFYLAFATIVAPIQLRRRLAARRR